MFFDRNANLIDRVFQIQQCRAAGKGRAENFVNNPDRSTGSDFNLLPPWLQMSDPWTTRLETRKCQLPANGPLSCDP